MRAQAMAQRVGDRGGAYGKRRAGSTSQRPTKRRGESGEGLRERLRSIARYLPLAGKFVLVVVVIALVITGYRAAASASFFQVHNVEVRGVTHASAKDIQAIVRRLADQKGLWRADVAAMSAQIERLPWVRTAIVTRVLPDSVRVRVTERAQRAVVRLSTGRFVWVDEDAVILSEMLPADQMPAFFLRGWNEDKSETAIAGNRERVQRYLELTREWSAPGLAERISEVNLMELRDVRVQLNGADAQIELRLGAQDFDKRLKKGLSVLDEERQSSYGQSISYIDLTQASRTFVGLSSGAKLASGEGENKSTDTEDEPPPHADPNKKPIKPRAAATERPPQRDNGTSRPRRTDKSTR